MLPRIRRQLGTNRQLKPVRRFGRWLLGISKQPATTDTDTKPNETQTQPLFVHVNDHDDDHDCSGQEEMVMDLADLPEPPNVPVVAPHAPSTVSMPVGDVNWPTVAELLNHRTGEDPIGEIDFQ